MAFYDDQKLKDWEHADTGAPVLKAQHPEFKQGRVTINDTGYHKATIWNLKVTVKAGREFSHTDSGQRRLRRKLTQDADDVPPTGLVKQTLFKATVPVNLPENLNFS